METRFTILLIEVGIAVTVQAIVLIGILIAVRKSSAKLEFITDDIHRRTVPILESSSALLATAKPQIESTIANLSESSTLLRNQVEDIIDRARLQVVRADELVTRTMDKVETTTELVQHSVISPVRQIAGVLQGVTMGFNVLFGRRSHNGQRHTNEDVGVPRDEMFI
jgi:ABC-type transporter Mla subunit MlaD